MIYEKTLPTTPCTWLDKTMTRYTPKGHNDEGSHTNEKQCCRRCKCTNKGKDNMCHDFECECHKDKGELKIVPSPRIDWCGDCKIEHGYDCPKDTATPEWEVRFDKEFEYSDGWHPGSAGAELEDSIKDFIRDLLAAPREGK